MGSAETRTFFSRRIFYRRHRRKRRFFSITTLRESSLSPVSLAPIFLKQTPLLSLFPSVLRLCSFASGPAADRCRLRDQAFDNVRAKGAVSSPVWGNVPGFVKRRKPRALKARFTSGSSPAPVRHPTRLKRAFSV